MIELDQPSRSAAFLVALRESGVTFVAVDMPEANDLTVGIMAQVAQAKPEAISQSTKVALASVKARGVKLGNPNGAESLNRAGKGGAALRATVIANAKQVTRDWHRSSRASGRRAWEMYTGGRPHRPIVLSGLLKQAKSGP